MTTGSQRRGINLAIWLALGLPAVAGASDFTQAWLQRFSDSRITLGHPESTAPMFPLAYLNVRFDREATVDTRQGRSLDVQQTNLSQAALLPIPLGDNDALMIGDWLSWTRFDTDSDDIEDFDVISAGLPVGWLHHLSPQWQAAGFVMPIGHRSSLDGGSWSLETMAGAFAQYIQRNDLWWAFGLYLDVDEQEEIYLPYLGASWAISEHWTLNALMPWPDVIYTPDQNTLFSVGASPTGSTWVLNRNNGKVQQDISGWDLGIGAERRVWGDLWLRAEAGYGGLRGISFQGGSWERPELDMDAGTYLRFGINYRPSLNH